MIYRLYILLLLRCGKVHNTNPRALGRQVIWHFDFLWKPRK